MGIIRDELYLMLKFFSGSRVKFVGLRERIEYYGQPLKTYWPAMFFIGGFVFDIFTLGRIDSRINILTHALYLLLVLGVLLTQILGVIAPPGAGRLLKAFFTYRNEAVHFFLGALLNAFVIFYFKSGTVFNDGLLLLLLAVLLVINEMNFFRVRGPALKMVLFNISLCSFFIYLLPVLIGNISSGIFILSLVCALLVMLGVWRLLLWAGAGFTLLRRVLLVPTGTVVLGFAVLYGAGMIPPVPLSLMQIGIYHNLERQDGTFQVYRQTPPWHFWSQGDQDFLARDGDRLYLFCRIFAPGGFRDKLFFHFLFRDGRRGWRTTDRIPVTIVGGRDRGFRGYAFKSHYFPGYWRALVETAEGLEVGRINFKIEKSEDTEPRIFYRERY